MPDVHPKILVTGSTGFIARQVCVVLPKNCIFVREVVRSSPPTYIGAVAVDVHDIR